MTASTRKWASFATVSVAMITAGAQADNLLDIDLSVVDQITITATSGLSAVSASGSNFTGVFMDGIFGANSSISATLVSGNLTSANNPSDNTPSLFSSSSDNGLNMWSFSSDSTVSFTAGSQAFAGSATWNIDSAAYALLLSGNSSGNIYFPADDASDIPGAQALGTYNVIPAPGSLALLGLGGLACTRRRRA